MAMLTLAEISDKVMLPLDPRAGGQALALGALVLGIALSVLARRWRWLAFAPSVIAAVCWYCECTDPFYGPAIATEFGVDYTARLTFWTLGLHAPVLLLVGFWPRRWSVRWPSMFGCQECGYDLRGLTGEKCPECGRECRPALSGEAAH